MNSSQQLPLYVPGSHKKVIPFMRDVFTIPTNRRQKPALIGSVCEECEEYFFPKMGQKATCDNPFCPRSTGTTLLSGRGKILSATLMRSMLEGQGERVSSVILLEEGIKINSPLIGWEGFEYLLVPGQAVDLVLQEMGLNDDGEMVVGYAFRLVTGRKKPQPRGGEDGAKSSGGNSRGKARAAAAKKNSAEKATKKKAAKKAAEKKAAEKKAVKKKTAEKKETKKKSAPKAAVKKAMKKKSAKKSVRPKKKASKKTVKKKISKKKTSKKPAPKKAPKGRKSKKR